MPTDERGEWTAEGEEEEADRYSIRGVRALCAPLMGLLMLRGVLASNVLFRCMLVHPASAMWATFLCVTPPEPPSTNRKGSTFVGRALGGRGAHRAEQR